MPIDIDVLNERMNNLINENKKEHGQIMKKLDSLIGRFDKLHENFVTRIEFDSSVNSAGEKIKNIENILKGAGGMVMVAILGSLLKLVVK